MRLSSIAVVLAALLAAPAAEAQDKSFAGVTLRVATYGGPWRDTLRDHVGSEIEKRGAKVEYVIGSPQDNLAKLIIARGRDLPFDVFEMSASMVNEVIAGDHLARLDLANIPNTAFLAPDQIDPRMVASWITQDCIVYNVEKFREFGIPKPERLQDLTNPKLGRRVSIPDISSGGGIDAVGGFALATGGDETNIEPGLRLIKEINPLSFWKSGGEVITKLKSGDVWAAIIHAGWGVRAHEAGVPVGTAFVSYGPGKRGLQKEGWIGVVRGTRHQAAAEAFINAYLAEEAQMQLALKNGTIPVHREARKRLVTNPTIKELLELDPERMAQFAKLDFKKIDLSRWNELWSRMVTR